ncbi:type IV pilus assembly protein PilX [Methylobacter tundripaludum]|uniref:Type IV pilus assembly protein PilX n=1 Tax=Methylobacter tundripaludum TaxID=173365 RepID=A0A2S6HKE5_9GAMM|nr:PilX N-terminal domain-containing pilus assembly protein [Methylobacter tundripaludum]PPK77940.1 type IV pilus assembly protein PilX [Methylobacter tundripaludum]
MINQYSSFKHQSGVVLPVSMIMLLLLTLISVTASQVTGLEEKMAGNSRDANLAFQAAEAALRAGEAATSGSPTLYTGIQPIDWTNAAVTTYSSGTLTGISSAPRYIIEDLGSTGGAAECSPCEAGTPPSSGGSRLYRITARGTGGTTNAVVVLQSIYKR